MLKIITICGSSRFKEEIEKTQHRLTLKGFVVLSLGFFSKYVGEELTDNEVNTLVAIHRQKIDMADEICVVTRNGYLGEHTKNEIEYAISKGKPVTYMDFTNVDKYFMEDKQYLLQKKMNQIATEYAKLTSSYNELNTKVKLQDKQIKSYRQNLKHFMKQNNDLRTGIAHEKYKVRVAQQEVIDYKHHLEVQKKLNEAMIDAYKYIVEDEPIRTDLLGKIVAIENELLKESGINE